METVTAQYGYKKTIVGRDVISVQDGVTRYQNFSLSGVQIIDTLEPIPSDIEIPKLVVELATEWIPVTRSRTIWNPVYPDTIPVPV